LSSAKEKWGKERMWREKKRKKSERKSTYQRLLKLNL
jgi:hypothetical protein